jgi:hypothetical protein
VVKTRNPLTPKSGIETMRDVGESLDQSRGLGRVQETEGDAAVDRVLAREAEGVAVEAGIGDEEGRDRVIGKVLMEAMAGFVDEVVDGTHASMTDYHQSGRKERGR